MSHRPKKRLGQHFLRDQGTLERILAAIAPQQNDLVVEIGPGQGALTYPLLTRLHELHVVELDDGLVRALRSIAARSASLVVHHCDALRFDFLSLTRDSPKLRIVGNLPYNISTPLLFRLLALGDRVRDMHFLLQKEVVDRLAATPGTKAYGRLSVMAQFRCRVHPLFTVAPEAFRPPPRVDSALVWLVPLEAAEIDARQIEPEGLADIVTRAFSKRRKTLRNALKGVLNETEIGAVGIDPGRRPDTLSVAEYIALARLGARPQTPNDA